MLTLSSLLEEERNVVQVRGDAGIDEDERTEQRRKSQKIKDKQNKSNAFMRK